MAQNISLWGANYSLVPSILLPKQGGGTASFTDVTDTTAAAADVASGKYFYTSAGVRTAGTNSGGGGTGLVYETGTVTPTADNTRLYITYTNSHTEDPIFVGMYDTSPESSITSNSNVVFAWFDPYRWNGSGYPYSTSARRYAVACYAYRSSNSTTFAGTLVTYNSDNTGSSSNTYSRYWVDSTGFHPYSNSTSRYWRSGRTYKWIAVWKPTS